MCTADPSGPGAAVCFGSNSVDGGLGGQLGAADGKAYAVETCLFSHQNDCGGTGTDGGTTSDAATDAASDAATTDGSTADAGSDGATGDAGTGGDASDAASD
jgi:hypothetical protein